MVEAADSTRGRMNGPARPRPLVTVVLGAFLVVLVHPVFGLPVAAFGLAGLTFRRSPLVALAVAVLVGVPVGLLAGTIDAITIVLPLVGVALPATAAAVYAAVLAGSLAVAGPLAAFAVRRWGIASAVGVATAALSALQVAALAVLAADTGQGLGGFVGSVLDGLTATLAEAGMGGSSASVIAESRDAIVTMWPSLMVVTNGLAAIGIVLVTALVAVRTGVRAKGITPFARFDLDPRAVLLPIAALALLAASRMPLDVAPVLEAVGLNALSVARWLFFVQGLAVVAALYSRLNAGRFTRITGYVLLGIAESGFWLGSILGLADIWLNLRKLPRDGAPVEPIDVPRGTD